MTLVVPVPEVEVIIIGEALTGAAYTIGAFMLARALRAGGETFNHSKNFVYLATALAQIRIRRRIEKTSPERLTLKMWLFPWLSYAVVIAIVGVLAAMGADHELRPQLMASLASLAVASAAYGFAAKRHHRKEESAAATGFLSDDELAWEGRD